MTAVLTYYTVMCEVTAARRNDRMTRINEIYHVSSKDYSLNVTSLIVVVSVLLICGGVCCLGINVSRFPKRRMKISGRGY